MRHFYLKKKENMIDFVDLMSCKSLGPIESEKDTDMYWCSDQWIMEPIYLGTRFQCLIDSSNKYKFLGKKKKYKLTDKFDKFSKLINELKSNDIAQNTLFEGYLTFNNDAKDVFKFLNSNHVDEKLINSSCLYITDIIYYDNRDVFNMSLFDRKKMLNKIFEDSENVKLQQGYTKDKKKIYEDIKNEFEIFLFKDLESVYKFHYTVACRIYKAPKQYFMVVMGCVVKDGKNMVVALEGGQFRQGELFKIMNVPVHGNEKRYELFRKKDEIVGKVFEFLANDRGIQEEKYLDSRFVSIREDKKIEDCIF